MSETRAFTCIGCPIGCPLQLEHEGLEITEVTGHGCNRGAKYARQEFTDPRRSISTTIAVDGALWARLPVKITQPVPKDRVMEAAKVIHELHLQAPVQRGQVLLENLLGEEGVNVVACRSLAALE